MTKEEKREIGLIIFAFIALIALILLPIDGRIILYPFIFIYLLVGHKVLIQAFKNIIRGQVFDENFLMTIATIGAFFLGEYPEAVAVMLFYSLGEFFQDYVLNKSRKSIKDLLDIKAEYANIKQDGNLVEVDPGQVEIGTTVYIKAGQRVPLDGIIIEGQSSLDVSALTGEFLPITVGEGEEILSGSINLTGLLLVKTTKTYKESTVSKILELVEYAQIKKAKTDRFISKFASVYTPIIVFAALFLAILPPLLIEGALFSDWIHRALIFLVISCPCALVISIPLSFFGGIGGASKEGILIKGGNYLEALSKIDSLVMDKTGTLTEGVFTVTKVHANGIDEEDMLELAATIESFSNHPISQSIRAYYNKDIDLSKIREVEEIGGLGIKALYMDKLLLAGNAKLMESYKIEYEEIKSLGSVVYLALEDKYLGYILVSDRIKEEAIGLSQELRKIGIENISMLTGDSKEVAMQVGKELEIYDIHAGLLPGDKLLELEKILEKQKKNSSLAFIGDGINDAPVLMRADIGIAMGALGSDSAIEAADIVIMDDNLAKIIHAISISKKTMRVVWQNIIMALGIKFAVLILGALGYANMWAAVFADVGVSIITILNSIRIYRGKS